MNKISLKLTVLFEKPFWIGVFERCENNKLTVAKITFGPEPKDQEIYDFILKNYYELKFSPCVENIIKEKSKNPKRIQRELKKQLSNINISTKSQMALKLQHEEIKKERKVKNHQQKIYEEKRQFELKQQKKKQKHRGR